MQLENSPFKVVTIGHIENQLVGEQIGASIGEMSTFRQYPGGFAVHTSIACARLGLDTALISRIGQDEFGKLTLSLLQNNQVNIDHIQPVEKSQTLCAQIARLEMGQYLKQLRPAQATLAFSEQDVSSEWLNKAQALIISAQQYLYNTRAIHKAIVCAKESKMAIFLALDLPKCYPVSELLERFVSELPAILPLVDVIAGETNEFVAYTNAPNLFDALTQLRSQTDAKLLCLLESGGSFWCDKTIPTDWKHAAHHAGFELPTANQLGSFEAFLATFVYGFSQTWSIQEVLKWANAAQALTRSRANGYQDIPSLKELKTFLSAHENDETQLESAAFNHLHHATTRSFHKSPELIMGFEFKTPEENRVNLIQQAIKSVQSELPHQALWITEPKLLTEEPLDWLGWKIATDEKSNATNLDLAIWPRKERVVAHVMTHPDDPYPQRKRLHETLLKLHQSCRKTERDLIIQLQLSKGGPITPKTLSQIMEAFLQNGIYADAWIVPMPIDAKPFVHIERVLSQYDPHCLGVLVQCSYSGTQQLCTALEFARTLSWCKGFILDEKCFASLLEQWKNNAIESQTLMSMIAAFCKTGILYWHSIDPKKIKLITNSEALSPMTA